MPLSLHQNGIGVANAGTANVVVGAIAAGDCIVVFVHGDDNSNGFTVSDATNPNANYIQKQLIVVSGAFTSQAYVLANSAAIANATITVTQKAGGSNTQSALAVEVWSGADLTAPYDVGASSTAASGAPASGNTPAVVGGSEVVIGWAHSASSATLSASSPLTQDQESHANGVASEVLGHNILSSASGAQSASFGTTDTTQAWAAHCAVIKAAVGSVAPTPVIYAYSSN